MNTQQKKANDLDFSQGIAKEMSFGSYNVTETQKSLRKTFEGLKMESSSEISMPLAGAGVPNPNYNISQINMNFEMESTINNTSLSTLSFSKSEEMLELSDMLKSPNRKRCFDNAMYSMHSDSVDYSTDGKRQKTPDIPSVLSFSLNSTCNSKFLDKFKKNNKYKRKFNKRSQRNVFNERLSLLQEEREEQLYNLRVLMVKKHLQLLELRMAQIRIQMKNEENLFKIKTKIHKTLLEILRCSSGDNSINMDGWTALDFSAYFDI